MMRGIRLGEILVENGLLTPQQVNQVLKQQKRGGRPFGVLAERMFGLDPQAPGRHLVLATCWPLDAVTPGPERLLVEAALDETAEP